MTTRLALLALVLLGLGQTKGFAQTLYNFTTDSTGAYASIASNMTATSITLGSAIKHDNYPPCGPTDGLGTDGWPTTNTFNVNTFNTNGWYTTFTLTPNMGYGFKVTGFSARSRRENLAGTADDGPIAMRYGYSTDGGVNWTTVNPGNPQSSNLCASGGVNRVWPSWTTLNPSGSIIFRIYGLSSGTSGKGDMFLRDVVVNGEVCANAPNIVLGPIDAHCFSANPTAASIPYTFTDGTEYTLSIPGLSINTPYASLNASPITFSIPGGTPAGMYPGSITVRNGCGFQDPTPATFTIVVNPLPVATVTVDETTICAGDPITFSFNESAYTAGTEFTVSAVATDNGGPSNVSYTDVIDGDDLSWTEGIEFNGALTVGTITVVNETTLCQSTTPGFSVVVNPLPIVSISETDDSGLSDDGIICFGGEATLTASGGGTYLWSTGSTDAAITVSPGATNTYTVTVTSADNCSAVASSTIQVNPLPDAVVTALPNFPICPGELLEIYFYETAYLNGTEFSLTGALTDDNNMAAPIGPITGAINGDHLDWTEGTEFTGDLSITNIVVTESVSGCSNSAPDLLVGVYDAPEFGFTAATENDGPDAGNNNSGPQTLDIDFCAGDHLTLSGYTDNGNIGYFVSFTTTGNVTYDGGLIPLASGPDNVSPASAASFFGLVYGGALGYGLSSGTDGTINQVFTPYLDNDNSGDLSAGDCEGAPMYLNYHIHAVPSVTVTPSDTKVCSGSAASIAFSGNYANAVTYSWTNDNPSVGVAASGSGDISFIATNNTNAPIVANLTVTPLTEYCEGAPVNFTITVYPDPSVSVTATVNGGLPQSGNNGAGPSTINLDFCAGQSFTYSLFSGTAGMGFIEEITGGTTNLLYGAAPIPVPRPQTNISAAGAAAFFAGTYGPYNLASGTYGWMSEVFTPYFDSNNDGDYDAGIDCLGDPITVIYKIYAPLVVTVTRNTNNICSGGTVDYTISTNASQNVLFDLTLTENTNAANPADLDDDNTFPIVLTGLSVNDLSPYNFVQTINNAVGKFDRGRVNLAVSNVHYANANVCTATVNNANPNTQVYPKPRLAAPVDKMICSGNSTNLDIDLDPSSLPSANAGNAGYGIRIDWTVVATGISGASAGNVVIYNNAGVETAINDIAQALALNVPANGPQTATYTITPRAAGPSNGFNADDCYGDPITIIVTVVPPAVPEIEGPSCLHEGGQIQLTGTANVMLPATVVSAAWSTDGSGHATVDNMGLVTGVNVGTTTVYYTVTDNAGCVSTAEFEVNVLGPIELEHIYTGDPIACGSEITIPVEVSNFCDIAALDYTFSWDENAFQLVTYTTPFQPAGGTFSAFPNPMDPGELYLSFYDDGNAPFGNDVMDGTVVLTYTLRAIGATGTYNIPDVAPTAEAANSNFLPVLVNTVGISVPIEPISLDLGTNPVVCPSDDFAHLLFSNVVGNPDYYVIDFDAAAEAAGFPNILEGTLVVQDGEIIIPLPNGLDHGSYQAVLVLSNTTYGCVSDEYLFSIIVDQTPPTASNPDPVNVACIFQIPAPNVNVVDDEADNCSDIEHLVVHYEPGLSSQTGTGCAGNPMIIQRVYSVTDEAGNTTYVTQTITAEDNVPPTVSTTGLAAWYPSLAAAEAAALARANATKQDGNGCTAPVGINVTLASASTPGPGCSWTIHVAVSDACGNLLIANYNTIVDVSAPTVTAGNIDDCYDEDESPSAPYFEYDYAVQAAIAATTATDDCDANLTITAVVTGNDCSTVITVTATDDCGKSSSVAYTTRVENDAPIITPYNPLALNGNCYTTEQEAIDAAIAATHAGDDCTAPGDLQYDAFVDGGCPAVVMVVVTDYCGNPSTISYSGVYIDTEDPTTDPDALYTTCFQSEAAALAELADASNPADNCSTEAELLASADAVFSGDPCDQTVVITFTDHCGRTTTETFTGIVIDATAPVVAPLAPLMYACVGDIDAPDINIVAATDNCDVQDIEWISDELPTTCPGTGTRTYRVYDCAGNFTEVEQDIEINDDVAPTWFTSPGDDLDRSFFCGDDISAALALEPVAEDNCGEVTVTLVSDVIGGGCTGRNRTRTWTAMDECGNSVAAPFTQVITIADQTAPTWQTLANALNATVECSNPTALAAAQALAPAATDLCDNTLNIVKTPGSFVAGSCPQAGTITNTWVATDDCGNTSTVYTQVISIVDTQAPTWTTPQGQPYPAGLNLTISCSDIAGYDFANSLVPAATDLCDASVSLTKSPGSFVPGGDCPGEGSFTNTWTASDDCGNPSVVFTQVITVVDNTAPSFDPNCQFMPLNLFTNPDGGPAADCHEGISLEVGQEIDYAYSWTVAGIPIDPLGSCIYDDCSPTASIVAEVVSITDVPGQTVEINEEYTAECVRQITVSFQLRDACGNVQPDLFTCVYNIIDNTNPLVFCAQIPESGGPSLPDDCYPSVAAAEAAALEIITPCDNCTEDEDLEISVSTVGLCSAAVTVTVKDCAQNQSSYTFYTRIDNGAPSMTVSAIPTCYPTVAAAQAAAIAGTTIVDDCDPYGSLTITAVTSGTCPATVTVTATDQCGHSRSVAYNGLCIGTVNSVTITTPASNGSSTCENETAALTAWLANHGGATASGSGIVWTYSPDPIANPELFVLNCTTHTKSVIVTFKATDGCGYMATTTATFSVSDNTPPTANAIANTNLTCNANIPGPNVNNVIGEADNCGTPTVTIFATSDNGASGCPGSPRIIVYQYQVTDAYCNSILVNQMITVVDNVAPTFTAPANITINVDANCMYNAGTGITGDVTNEADNCTPAGPGLQAVYTDVVTAGTGFQNKWSIARTWTLTDACGNPAIPRVQTITVKDVTNPTLAGCPGNVSLPGSIIENQCGAYAGAVSNPTYSDNCSGSTIAYVLSGATMGSGNGYVPGTTVLAEGQTTVTYTVTDAVGNTATCSFTITVNCLTIAGRIIWEHDDVSGVKDATVKLSQGMTQLGTDLSDANGNYDLTVPNAGTFRVTPVKNINRLNGVTSADATRITNHVNFSNPITDPYKKVCADVNRSGIINTQDATLITQCLAGNPTALAVFNVFWRFTPTDYVMPATAHQNVPAFPEFKDVPVSTMDVTGVDFFGMKIGDVDAVWADPQMAPSIPPLVWVLQDQTLVAGTDLELTFAASNFNDLASYQFALDFDPTQLQFVGFQPLGALPMNLLDNFGAYNANLGELRNVWAAGNGATLADGTPVFRAKFKVLASGQKLSDVLKLDESAIECKAFSEALVPTDVKLVFASSVGTDTPLDLGKLQLQLMQNRPNPFTDATTIGFILPEACQAHIRILDISGRELTSYDRNYTAGYHELDFRMENAASYGVLFCELTTPQGKRTIKMITTK